ncbi:hypothetical protein TIFTF001_003356 [Ficus carica]|uniref:Glycosyltransferase n=1 Tax=Ficus carica TaxID=3494 RepID=A0AA87ZH25_FICCA|nr:hypothetical protein TIFTF001_003356 [Ficus carica]
MEDVQKSSPIPHIAIVPTPGMGHLFPLIEFAKRLVVHNEVGVTFIIPNDGSSMELQKKLLQSLPKPISFVLLPPVNFDDLPEDSMIETRIELTLTRSLPALHESLKSLTAESTHLVAIVVDVFGPSAFDVARELGILPYIFFPTTAMVLSFFFYLPELDASTSSEYRHLPEPIKLPGCPPVQGCDLFNPLHNRKTETYKSFVRMADRYKLAHGIMVNSFTDLEPGAFTALKEKIHNNPPVYPVGPMIQTCSGNDSSDQSGCLSWLDKQPNGSVMFVSFGSGGTLSHEQLTELAFGLETSGQRFIWVVKSPNEKSSEAAFFSLKSTKNPLDYLPTGFLERTKDVGLVVESWAPQVQVLSHDSTGGFLSHCGWNSTLESVVNGMPLIAWPLYAEQRMNAVFLADDLKVALRVKPDEKGLVDRDQIAMYAKELMQGEEGKLLRNRMKELKEAAKMALSDGGSSTKSLAEVAQIWKSHKN